MKSASRETTKIAWCCLKHIPNVGNTRIDHHGAECVVDSPGVAIFEKAAKAVGVVDFFDRHEFHAVKFASVNY
jgi:hypothetical protein